MIALPSDRLLSVEERRGFFRAAAAVPKVQQKRAAEVVVAVNIEKKNASTAEVQPQTVGIKPT